MYRRLLAEVGTWLKRHFARYLLPGMVDNAVQDTLLAIHAKRHTCDPARPFGSWPAAVSRHRRIDRLRTVRTGGAERPKEDVTVGDHGDAVTSAWSLDRLLQTQWPAQSDAIHVVEPQGAMEGGSTARVGLGVSQKPTAIRVVYETGRRLWRGRCATDPGQVERTVRGMRKGMPGSGS